MRLLSFLVTTSLIAAATEAASKQLKPKGPPCPDGDGLYAVGCSTKYLQCVNNVEYEHSCPEGLYFDRLMARCERRSSNYLCNTDRKVLNVRQKAVSMSCIGRPSGDYPLEQGICNENYYQCANGIFYMRKCPYSQMYIPHLKRCDYEHNCFASDIKVHPAAAYASPRYDADKYEVTAFEVNPEDGPKGINCVTLGDATIGDGVCSKFFWQCANGKLFKKTCPAGLFYVIDQNLCDYPQGVKGCPEYNGSETVYEPAPTRPADPYVPPKTTDAPQYVPPVTTTTSVEYVYVTPKTTTAAPKYVPPVASTIADYVKATQRATTTKAPEYLPASGSSYIPPPAAPPAADEPDLKVNCDNKSDGFYEIKSCHKNFLACSSGHSRVIACAHELVFDTRTNACDYPDKCNGPRAQEDVPQLYNHGGVHDDKPVDKRIDFDCSDKSDGTYFKEPCVKEYFQCLNKRAFALSCPADLVYNRNTGTCDFADNCEKNYMEPSKMYFTHPAVEYNSKPASPVYTRPTTTRPVYTQPPPTTQPPVYTTKAPSTTVGYQQPSSTVSSHNSTVAPTTPASDSDDFNCANQADGNYASGACKSIFYTCSNNHLVATKCPGSLIFNPYVGQCDYASSIPDCRGEDQPVEGTTVSYTRPTTAEYSPAPNPQYTEAPIVSTSTAAPQYTTPAASQPYTPASYQVTKPPKYHAFCERLGDGNYGSPCKDHFFQCANFETVKVLCPDGLRYDLKNDKCDHPENVAGCPEHIPRTTVKSRDWPNIDYTTTTPGPIDTTPIAEAFSCVGRVDGIYALPYCSRDYVQCMYGRTLVTACAAGLYYSEKSGLCDYKDNVPICKIRKGADVIDNDACLGKSDGYYSAGCSSHYFSCIGETIRKLICPNKLKFSEKKGVCDYPTDVSECSITKQPAQSPPAVPADFCTIRPNGLHPFRQCSPHYIVCENGAAISGTCAAPLVFNGHNQLCDYKSNNKECVSEYVPTTAAAPSGNYNQQPTTASTTAKPYQKPVKTTTRAYVQPTTTSSEPYQQPTTTTTTTTTTQKPYETTTPAEDVPSTTTPTTTTTTTTTTQKPYYETTTVPVTTTKAADETVPTTTTTSTTTAQPYSQPTTTESY